MLCIHRNLDVVAYADAGVALHGAGIWIGQRQLILAGLLQCLLMPGNRDPLMRMSAMGLIEQVAFL